jgi:hypothetical protein
MAQTLGIDFGYSTKKPSLGYAHFDTSLCDKTFTVSVLSSSKISTLANFKNEVLKQKWVKTITVIALDAPITPRRIDLMPNSGRQVEKRFSRGEFHNKKRGPQPSSISVPRQGWPLYCGAMDLMTELQEAGFAMPAIPATGDNPSVDFSGKVCVEVCPKMTQTLLTPKSRVVSRPDKKVTPIYYRQTDNWLFPHLFVATAPINPHPGQGPQPNWGVDRLGMVQLLGDRVQIDKSVWDEATRIASVRSLPERHELIGAFVAGFQGAITLAEASVVVGMSGDYEGYYILPSKWHNDWCRVWDDTTRPDDCVKKFPILLPDSSDALSKNGGP